MTLAGDLPRLRHPLTGDVQNVCNRFTEERVEGRVDRGEIDEFMN